MTSTFFVRNFRVVCVCLQAAGFLCTWSCASVFAQEKEDLFGVDPESDVLTILSWAHPPLTDNPPESDRLWRYFITKPDVYIPVMTRMSHAALRVGEWEKTSALVYYIGVFSETAADGALRQIVVTCIQYFSDESLHDKAKTRTIPSLARLEICVLAEAGKRGMKIPELVEHVLRTLPTTKPNSGEFGMYSTYLLRSYRGDTVVASRLKEIATNSQSSLYNDPGLLYLIDRLSHTPDSVSPAHAGESKPANPNKLGGKQGEGEGIDDLESGQDTPNNDKRVVKENGISSAEGLNGTDGKRSTPARDEDSSSPLDTWHLWMAAAGMALGSVLVVILRRRGRHPGLH